MANKHFSANTIEFEDFEGNLHHIESVEQFIDFDFFDAIRIKREDGEESILRFRNYDVAKQRRLQEENMMAGRVIYNRIKDDAKGDK